MCFSYKSATHLRQLSGQQERKAREESALFMRRKDKRNCQECGAGEAGEVPVFQGRTEKRVEVGKNREIPL